MKVLERPTAMVKAASEQCVAAAVKSMAHVCGRHMYQDGNCIIEAASEQQT